jgi:hypothetical protein
MTPKEHRRGQRIAATMWLRLSNSGAEIGMGSLVNVSLSGAYLETRIQLPVNASITLQPAAMAGVALEGLKLNARVARFDDRGLGIEWRALISPAILTLLTTTPARPPDPNDDEELQPAGG